MGLSVERAHSMQCRNVIEFYLFAGNVDVLVVSTTCEPVVQLLEWRESAGDTGSSAHALDCSRMDFSLVWNLEVCFLYTAARSRRGSSKCNFCRVDVGLVVTTCSPTACSDIMWLHFRRKTVLRTLHVICPHPLPPLPHPRMTVL
jgi:hypothetical protein